MRLDFLPTQTAATALLTRARRRGSVSSLLAITLGVVPGAAVDQALVDKALASFPPQTIRVEYSSPARLRALPNYASLRQRYVGAELAKLEVSLSDLGVDENAVNELMLGWRPGTEGMELYGLATGRFNTSLIAQRAKARGLDPEMLDGHAVYCLGAGLAASCVAVFDPSLGAFGTLASLTAILDARAGSAPALISTNQFANVLKGAQTQTAIWGVAVGSAVGDWFKGWMPGQGNVQLDWSSIFRKVEWLSYSVDTAEKVSLGLKLYCASPEAASSLRQTLEGLKLAQQLIWQAQNPNRPNPFEAMDVELTGRQIALKLSTAYAALEGI